MSVLDLFSLAGQTIVVTGAGAGGGLGRAIAVASAEAGANVVCADLIAELTKRYRGWPRAG